MLSLQRLLVLCEVERLGTLAAAARSLSYTPSAVSQQLARLESEVGVALTEPAGRGVRLTDASTVLVAHARTAMAELERAETELATLRGAVAGRVRVATFQTGMLSLLPPALHALEDRHPDLRVDVAQREAGHAVSGLQAGAFDVVLGEEYPGDTHATDRSLDRADLGDDELLLAVPRTGPWAAATGVGGVARAGGIVRNADAARIADLAQAPWALETADSAPGRWARAYCRAAGFEADVRFDGIDVLTHVRLVQSGSAVSLLPALLGPQRTAGVRLVHLPDTPHRRLFTLTRRTRAAHPAVVALREALSRAFAAQEVPGAAPTAAKGIAGTRAGR